MTTKKNTIKGVKAWALIHEGHIFPTSIFYRKKDAVKEKCEWNKLTPVLITPITKVVKNKVGK